MKTTLMTLMMTSISDVMETMFFLPVEPAGTSPVSSWCQDKPLLVCSLAFHGQVSGTLILAAPDALVTEMAENFLGEPKAALTPDHLSGTLTEMLNMVCGSALSRAPSEAPYGLDIPKITTLSAIPENEECTIIRTPDAEMLVSLTLD